MYLTTFYSFKGGVGRTMAAANTAVALADNGKRVLLVDFDLEAPGLSTYAPFAPAKGAATPGVVDFVVDFERTNEGPDAAKYITRCAVSNKLTGEVWIMPAGRADEDYGARLASIDWQKLYAERHGYLLFEDLKQQWQRHAAKFDYVFVDSRTGHTDVGGICTRQLPDAVVMMFFPNEENIEGLARVAREVRADSNKRQKTRDLIFCPSNVPALDDEHEILKGLLDKAKRELVTPEFATPIHRYDSLMLLTAPLFVLDRPRSRLADEYRKLTEVLVKGNVEAQEGALAKLREVRRTFEGDVRRTPSDMTYATQQIDNIARIHKGDGEVAWELSLLYAILGRRDAELEALDVVLGDGLHVADALFRRGMVHLTKSNAKEAVEDFESVLSQEDVDGVRAASVVEVMRTLDAGWLAKVVGSPAVGRLAPDDLLPIVDLLMTERGGLDEAVRLSERVISIATSAPVLIKAESYRLLGLVGSGRFAEALASVGLDRGAIAGSGSIQIVFNCAMAEWGMTRKPPVDLLGRVLELASRMTSYGDANFNQCLSLVSHLLGDADGAFVHLMKAQDVLSQGRTFSAWKYLSVDRPTMVSDLADQERFLRGEGGPPAFLRQDGR